MLRDYFLVFDDFLSYDPAHSTETTYDLSSDALSERIASHDVLACFVVAQDEGGHEGSLSVYIQHCADGIDFVNKDEVETLVTTSWSAGGTGVAWGYDSGTIPTLNFARLLLIAEGDAPHLTRVRVYVALRDLDELQPPPPGEHFHDWGDVQGFGGQLDPDTRTTATTRIAGPGDHFAGDYTK